MNEHAYISAQLGFRGLRSADGRDRALELLDRYDALLAEIQEGGQRSGELRIPDVRTATPLVLSALNWMARWYRAGGEVSAVEFAERYSDMLLQGFLPRGAEADTPAPFPGRRPCRTHWRDGPDRLFDHLRAVGGGASNAARCSAPMPRDNWRCTTDCAPDLATGDGAPKDRRLRRNGEARGCRRGGGGSFGSPRRRRGAGRPDAVGPGTRPPMSSAWRTAASRLPTSRASSKAACPSWTGPGDPIRPIRFVRLDR
jgi:hypothetical protein